MMTHLLTVTPAPQLSPSATKLGAVHLDDATKHLEADGVSITSHHQPGVADTDIVKLANERDAQLIIMGASGHSGLRARILGSTTLRVLRDCTNPVLIVQ